jgi:hypothetical protein
MSLYVNATYIVNHTHEMPRKPDDKESLPLANGSVNRGDLVFTYLYDNKSDISTRKPYRRVGDSGLVSKVFTSMPKAVDLQGQIRVAGIANSASTIAPGRDLEASLQIAGQCQLRMPSMRTKVNVGDALYVNAFTPSIRDYTKGDGDVQLYVPVVYTVPFASHSLEKMLSDASRMATDWIILNKDVSVHGTHKKRFFESRVKPHLVTEINYTDLSKWSKNDTMVKSTPYYKYFKTLTLCLAWLIVEEFEPALVINELIKQSVDNHRDYYIGTCIETSTSPFCAVIRR